MAKPRSASSDAPHASLSDRALLARSRHLGSSSRTYHRRFLSTLPEIDRRGLAERHGGITAYGAKVGGATPTEVQEILALHRRLSDLPAFWRLYESGEVGRQTLRRVPVEFLAKDPEAWLGHLRRLSRKEVVELVAAEKARLAPPPPKPNPRPAPSPAHRTSANPADLPGQGLLPNTGGGPDPRPAPKADPENTPTWSGPYKSSGGRPKPRRHRVTVELSEEEYARFLVLQRERSKEAGRPCSQTEVLRALVTEAVLDAWPDEAKLSDAEREAVRVRAEAAAKEATGRAAPRPVEREVRLRSAGTCERSDCVRPGETFHHQIKWRARRARLPARLRGLPRHHPDAVVHLCSTCHNLLHEGCVENPGDPPQRWTLLPAGAGRRSDVHDLLFQEARQRARGSG